jgi:hypothetical protein
MCALSGRMRPATEAAAPLPSARKALSVMTLICTPSSAAVSVQTWTSQLNRLALSGTSSVSWSRTPASAGPPSRASSTSASEAASRQRAAQERVRNRSIMFMAAPR